VLILYKVIMSETRDREIDTDYATAMGTNVFAPTQHVTREEKKVEARPNVFVTDHQPMDEFEEPADPDARGLFDDEDEDEIPFVRTDAERDAELRASLGVVPRPVQDGFNVTGRKWPAKRPRTPEPSDEEDDMPDLAEIFDNYDVPIRTRISVCRAYASYLAAQLPKKPRAPKTPAAPRKK